MRISRGAFVFFAILILCPIFASLSVAKRTPRTKTDTTWRLKMFIAPGYRSNVYKAPPPVIMKNDNVEAGGVELKLEHKLNRRLHITAVADADGEFYAKYTRRNQTNFGGEVEVDWRPSRHWRFRAAGDRHRSTRDLIDDSGEFSGRTLAKWVTDLTPELRYTVDNLHAALTYSRSFTNYDESVDSSGVRLKSYDFDDHTLEADLRLEVSRRWQFRTVIAADWRDYKERRTLSINKRSSQPRHFSQTTFEPQLDYVAKIVSPYFRYSFTRRKDAFENFYGYDYSKYKIGCEIRATERLSSDLSFEYEDKDYPNYWTSRIGNAHRVAIQYRDWRVTAGYKLLPQVELTSDLRWYVKTSNDRNFRYRQLSFFLGCEIELGNRAGF